MSGVIEGKWEQLLTQLYGVGATPAWSGGIISVLKCQRWCRTASRETRRGGLEIRNTEALRARYTIQIPLRCPLGVHDYVGSLSSQLFNHVCLDTRRDGITQVRPNSANPEKVRVHNPLGNTTDLARHLILSALAVPA